MPEHKQVKKSFESQSIYLPLMNIVKFYEKNISVKESEKLFKQYLKEQKITNSKELKNNLFNICFHNFSEELFDVVYNNSNQVVWKIDDKKLFD
jgi:UDP-galactopyranose mutase